MSSPFHESTKMKLTKFTNLLVIATVLAFAVGCQKNPTVLTKIPGSHTGAPGDIPNEKPFGSDTNLDKSGSTIGIPAVSPDQFANYIPHPEQFEAQTVHFDFDRSEVKEGERGKVEVVAAYMKAHPTDAVRIEGHCDERGTEEYNRALGDRRANALREEMARLGADPNRIPTVSYGEDRPADPGHNEEAWRKNRRGVFILLTPP